MQENIQFTEKVLSAIRVAPTTLFKLSLFEYLIRVDRIGIFTDINELAYKDTNNEWHIAWWL